MTKQCPICNNAISKAFFFTSDFIYFNQIQCSHCRTRLQLVESRSFAKASIWNMVLFAFYMLFFVFTLKHDFSNSIYFVSSLMMFVFVFRNTFKALELIPLKPSILDC